VRSSRGIEGTISSHLGDLKHVTRIDLSDNRLLGTIPASLSNCPALRTVVCLTFASPRTALLESFLRLDPIVFKLWA
jgi:hypothetical protein